MPGGRINFVFVIDNNSNMATTSFQAELKLESTPNSSNVIWALIVCFVALFKIL